MEKQEILEVHKEENDAYVKTLENARAKLEATQTLCEEDFPVEDRTEWLKQEKEFIEQKLEFGYALQEEDEQAESFYDFEGTEHKLTPEQEDYLLEYAREQELGLDLE